MKRLFRKKIGFGRIGLPAWFVGLAALGAIGAAAGQAVGPVLAGSVQGTASVTAEQAVVLSSNADKSFVGGESATSSESVNGASGLVVVNDEGTSFTAAIESFVGQSGVHVHLNLDNNSNATANAVLELNVPAGVDVEVDSAGGTGTSAINEAQLSGGTWLLEIPPNGTIDENARVSIEIEPKDDLKPGHYNISGRIVQIGG